MNIGAVIVTYNRLEKLKKCLSSYEKQTLLPAFILIIDNHSTDGTSEYLDEWAETSAPFEKIIYHSDSNTGGAGGFTLGIKTALTYKPDWIWLADDDAYPTSNCLELMSAYYDSLTPKTQAGIASLCCKVVDNNGLSPLHRRRIQFSFWQCREIPLAPPDYEVKTNEISLFSFVGTLIRTDVIKKAGLPRSDYFICFDDSEYALRIGQYGKIICLSDAVILHDSLENTITSYSWQNYYRFRNKLYTYGAHFKKRHCFTEFVKHLYMVARYYNTSASWKQLSYAIKDALAGRLGKNNRYLP